MPYIAVRISKTVSAAQVQQLASGITDIMTDTLCKQRSLVAVSIESIPASHWFVASQNMAELQNTTAFVSGIITEGTNTEAEKSHAIAAIFALLTEVLGVLAEASYIVLDCVPATNWGYSGKTQANRKATGEKS
ncbi:tautomerase family protein [Thiothrix litoralis]|uniref:Tautomerase family protein n=1 Tax=Thiothrix litoralis TaxID=2891210 RepID=A0ABX7WP79_9GAMM|nr:tautomerase family protein [Thiothrix litoralis]QTR44806.1 tautomerase family protein [Thiothrix litoralis]